MKRLLLSFTAVGLGVLSAVSARGFVYGANVADDPEYYLLGFALIVGALSALSLHALVSSD